MTESALVGKTINNYEVLEEIAESNWGRVLKVKPHDLNRVRAMKLVRPEHVSRLYNEKECLEKLGGHPNVIDIHDANFSGSHQYIVVDYAEASLRDMLKKNGKFHYGQAFEILRGIAKGLQHAHKNGILHRDLKPENVLIQGGTVKLCDFNLAKQHEALEDKIQLSDARNVSREIVGTPDYMAPEQQEGKATEQSDIYALGVMAYELLTGRIPGRSSPKPSEFGAPKWVDNFVYTAMADRPADRHGSIDSVLKVIDDGLVGKYDTSFWNDQAKPALRKVGSAAKSMVKHTLLSPFYVLGAPFIIGSKLAKISKHARSDSGKEAAAGIGSFVSFVAGVGFYLFGAPIMGFNYAERKLEEAIKQDARGTIVCNDNNIIYVFKAEDICRHEAFPRRKLEMPVGNIGLMAPSPDETKIYFTTLGNNADGKMEYGLYRLTLGSDKPERPEKEQPEKIAASALFRNARGLKVVTENDADVALIDIGGEVWAFDGKMNFRKTEQTELKEVYSTKSPCSKFALAIDRQNDLEILLNDDRWGMLTNFGNMDIVRNMGESAPLRNYMWLKK